MRPTKSLCGAAHTARQAPWLVMMALSMLVLPACAPAPAPQAVLPTATFPGAPTPTATASPTPDPATQLPGWSLVWQDEFNGASLDTSKWNVASDAPGGYQNCCLNNNLNAWVASDVSLTNGILRLTTRRQSFQGKVYTSGAVTTQDRFDFLYGRIDIRARLPKGNGIWPAFWLLPSKTVLVDNLSSYEVDVMEALGQDPHTDYMVHWWGAHHEYCRFTGPDFSAGYHVFSFIWSATAISWLIDGKVRCKFTSEIPNAPMYLILNDRIGGSWPVPPDTSTVLPQYTDIDYVRVYTPA